MYTLKISKEDTSKYNYKTAKIECFKTLKGLGLPSNYFGGRVHKICKLKNEETMLIIDDLQNVIGILEPKEIGDEISETTLEGEGNYKCDCGKTFDNKQKITAHKRFCGKGGS